MIFFYRMILNTKRILFEESSPQELNKCLQKFYLSARKSHDRGRSVITRQNCNRWQQFETVNDHFRAQLSHCFSIY